jgi:PAS domain S-box-containing protein
MKTNEEKKLSAAAALRQRAEEQLKATASETDIPRSDAEAHRLFHELQVHQIELKIQNDELRLARDDVEASLEKYADLYDFAPVGYFTLDQTGIIISANLCGAQLLGVERYRLLGRRFGLFFEQNDRSYFSGFLGKLFASRERETCELTLVNESKSPLNALIEAVVTASGQECRLVLIDITGLKQLETAQSDSEEKYLTIIQTAMDAFYVVDMQGRLLDVNSSYCQMSGYSPQELLAMSITDLEAIETPEDTANHIREVMAQGEARFETRHRRKDGTLFDVEASVKYTPASGGLIVVFLHDITARKKLEANLHQIQCDLELKVLARTNELSMSNAQLIQEAEERSKSKESLRIAYSDILQLQDRLKAENIYLQNEVAQEHNFGEIIGHSETLTNVFNRIQQVAPMNATVLLLGETGTGKGVVANSIHCRSSRKEKAMVTVNCSSLPANLIESELFGREKGAFTGAHDRQIGRFELANGGTIFLDEIGEMPMELQSKLLRVIQDGEFERLGSPRTIKVDVRIIAATNRNLEEEIRRGRFREDLFYRLNVFPIAIPPLRQRKEDIPLLVNHFVAKFNKKNSRNIQTVTKATLNALQEYRWPGNVRELESVIERAVIITEGPVLQIIDRFETSRKSDESAEQDVKELTLLEHDHILQVLKKTGWRVAGEKGAAKLLGINPSTLRARMRKYGISRQA